MNFNLMRIFKSKHLLIGVCIILFIIPFFWLKPGEMDLGGDSTRLYFYDPLSYLKSFVFYSVASWGTGIVSYNQYYLPFLLFMIFLKFLFHSPTILIDIFNGLKLSGSFLFMFLIIEEFLQKEGLWKITFIQWLGITLGALFYTLSPSVIDTMKYALNTQNQVVLNPMIFYFLLRSLITSSLKYLWVALLIAIIFSSNFSLQAPPPLFAFYPLAITFLLFYNFFVLKKSFPWKIVVIGIFFFLGLHSFHLIPVVTNVFDKGSELNTRAFENISKVNFALEYFKAILSYGKVSEHILLPLENQNLSWILIIVPTLMILGFFSLKKRNKTILLVSIFFFITLFLVSANITQIGVEVYKKLFYIPGFGMFRNFYGQWQWVYTFFYALLAGLAISYLFLNLKKRYVCIFFIFTIGIFIAHGLIIFNGEIVNVFHRGSKDVKVLIRMDPNYEKTLSYIKNIPNDGKILHMPFTDYGYDIVGGLNKGAYIGASMVSLLDGKNDFAGYQNIDPFSEVFVKLSKERNYPLIKQMMSLLQIRYVLYNSDELVSGKFFPTFPYGYVGTPTSQSGLKDFVNNISEKKIYEAGHYSIFEVNKDQYLPHFYAASTLLFYDTNPKYDVQYSRALSFFPQKPIDKKDIRIAFVDRQVCKKILPGGICSKSELNENIDNVHITYQRINPTKYKIEIENATEPFLLIFQNAFNPYWKLYSTSSSINTKNISDEYFNKEITELQPINETIDKNPFETNSMKSIFDDTHMQVNGYANAWYIKPNKSGKHELIVEMTGQKIFYYGLIISLISLLIFVLYGVKLFKKNLFTKFTQGDKE